MRLRIVSAVVALWAALVAPALAVDPDEQLGDPAQEARAREISRILRCVVCKSQSIDDSDAPLAKDLRLLVRERIVAGDSDEEVIDFVRSRYGDYVLLKPRFSAVTVILWAGPFIMLGLGGLAAVLAVRRTRAGSADADDGPVTE